MAVPHTQNIEITRVVLISFLTIVLAFAIWLIRDIVMLTLTAVVLAILLTTPIRFFTKRKVPRPLAVVLTLLLVIGVISLTFTVALPPLVGQFSQLFNNTIPKAVGQIQTELTPEKLRERLASINLDFEEISKQINTQVLERAATFSGTITSQFTSILNSIVSLLVSILIVLFLMIYFITDPQTHQQGFLRLVPLWYRTRAKQILAKLDAALRLFLQAQLLLMILTGLSTGIMLLVLGVPLPAALGTLAGALSFVPNFGPLLALIPVLLVVLVDQPERLLLIVVFYYTLQFIISQIIAPLLLGQGLRIPPALILLAQIVAGVFFGFLGILLAVPLAAITVVLIREIYIKDILGDYSDAAQPKPRSSKSIELIAEG